MSRKYNLIIERGVSPEKVFSYEAVRGISLVDLRPKLKIMYDQGNLGSCTANALCYAYVFDAPNYSPSRLFLYYNERMLDNDISIDAGSTLSQGINALKKFGVCSETLWAYNISKFAIKPQTNAYSQGLLNQVIQSSRVAQTLTSLKGCLSSGFPFVVGILVYSSFESKIANTTGYVPMPNTQTEQLLGGHAVICLGYNDAKQIFIMQNSWGTGWGDKGYFYLPYAYLTSTTLAGDIWKITQVETPAKIVNTSIPPARTERIHSLILRLAGKY